MKNLHDLGEALDRLLSVVVLLGNDMDRALGELGLTVARTHVLWLLHHGGASTQRALADALDVTPRNVTGLVDALESDGLVRREPHPDDRRAVLVRLTTHGTHVIEQMSADHRELARHLFGDLPPARVADFVATLDHVASRLEAASGEPRDR